MEDFNIEDLSEKFECSFNDQKCGNNWSRVFVTNSRGCQIARIGFEKDKLYFIKNYKRDYHTEVCETDFIMMRMEKYLADGLYLDKREFRKLINKAFMIQKSDYQQKRIWRINNPKTGKNRRRALQKKNVRMILKNLIRKL